MTSIQVKYPGANNSYPENTEGDPTCYTSNKLCNKIIRILPAFLITLGAMLIAVGIPLTILGNVDTLAFKTGDVTGAILLVFGTAIVCAGTLWLMYRNMKKSRMNYRRYSSGLDNPTYNSAGFSINLNVEPGTYGPMKLGYVPYKWEEWMEGGIHTITVKL